MYSHDGDDRRQAAGCGADTPHPAPRNHTPHTHQGTDEQGHHQAHDQAHTIQACIATHYPKPVTMADLGRAIAEAIIEAATTRPRPTPERRHDR